MSDKKYREFWIVNDVTFRDAVGRMAYSDKSFAKGDILHVVDAESYQDLERKLAIAVEAMKAINPYIDLQHISPTKIMFDEALAKIQGEE